MTKSLKSWVVIHYLNRSARGMGKMPYIDLKASPVKCKTNYYFWNVMTHKNKNMITNIIVLDIQRCDLAKFCSAIKRNKSLWRSDQYPALISAQKSFDSYNQIQIIQARITVSPILEYFKKLSWPDDFTVVRNVVFVAFCE